MECDRLAAMHIVSIIAIFNPGVSPHELVFYCITFQACAKYASLPQALEKCPNDENLKADLQEVQACLQPATSTTLRSIADKRFRCQVCLPHACQQHDSAVTIITSLSQEI